MLNTNILEEKLEYLRTIVEYTITRDKNTFKKLVAQAEFIASKEKRFNGKSLKYMFETLRKELVG